MKVAWGNFKSTFKRHLGEDGIYLLCIVLFVKMAFDTVFSSAVWSQLDRLTKRQDEIARQHNARLNESTQQIASDKLDRQRSEQQVNADLEQAKQERHAYQTQLLDILEAALNKLNAAGEVAASQQHELSQLISELHKFVATRGYNPFTADEMDRWIASANDAAQKSGLSLKFPPRPEHLNPHLKELWDQPQKGATPSQTP